MITVNIPVIDYDGMEAGEALIKFYTSLGFDSKKHTLNPKKVKISEADFLKMTEKMKSLNLDNSTAASFMMLNYGPSCDYTMKNGKVRLHTGWIVTS